MFKNDCFLFSPCSSTACTIQTFIYTLHINGMYIQISNLKSKANFSLFYFYFLFRDTNLSHLKKSLLAFRMFFIDCIFLPLSFMFYISNQQILLFTFSLISICRSFIIYSLRVELGREKEEENFSRKERFLTYYPRSCSCSINEAFESRP